MEPKYQAPIRHKPAQNLAASERRLRLSGLIDALQTPWPTALADAQKEHAAKLKPYVE